MEEEKCKDESSTTEPAQGSTVTLSGDIIPAETVSISRGIREQVVQLDAEKLDEPTQKLYDTCIPDIRKSIGDGPFTMDKIVPIINVITRAVQEYAQSQEMRMAGTDKQVVAMNITRHVLKELRNDGRMSEDAYQYTLIAVGVAGPVLITLVVSAWKKAVATKQDIAAHGCAGCAKRNCCVIA